MDLIAEVPLEWDPSPDKARATYIIDHLPRHLAMRVAEVVPDAQADCPLVLLGTLANSPAPFGDMLY